jgi:hypothetical protein
MTLEHRAVATMTAPFAEALHNPANTYQSTTRCACAMDGNPT